MNWIKSNERLPKPKQRVVGYWEELQDVSTCYYDYEGQFWHDDNMAVTTPDCWIDLPNKQ